MRKRANRVTMNKDGSLTVFFSQTDEAIKGAITIDGQKLPIDSITVSGESAEAVKKFINQKSKPDV